MRRIKAIATAVCVVMVSGVAVSLVATASDEPPEGLFTLPGTCVRDIETIAWLFDPCVPEGEIPDDVALALEEYRLLPTPSMKPTGPASSSTATATLVGTASPTESINPSDLPGVTASLPPTVPPGPTPCADGEGSLAADIGEAARDLIGDRCTRMTYPIALVALGDSITSAAHQYSFGFRLCENMAADHRNLKGNQAWFGYPGSYALYTPEVVRYYNFARIGFLTSEVLSATKPTKDACDNQWDRDNPPIALAEAAVRKARADGMKAYVTVTSGANNANWVKVMNQLGYCRALEYAQSYLAGILRPGLVTFRFYSYDAANKLRPGRTRLFPHGGSCQLSVFADTAQTTIRKEVDKYTGPAVHAGVTRDAAQIVTRSLTAGADKVAWMLYPHITNAQVDVANAMWSLLRFNAGVPAGIRAMLPHSITPWYEFLVDREWRAAVRTAVDELNRAITNGVPRNAKVTVVPAPGLTQADFQYTIAGGCPHPSLSGHDKLYRALAAAYAAIP